jgi:hypothetical protein
LKIQGTPQQQAFLQNPLLPPNTPGIQQYISLVGSGSSIATTGQNPAFLQPTIEAKNLRYVGAGVADVVCSAEQPDR